MWQNLATAFCLMLILEGIIPFLYPNRWKQLVQRLSEVDTHTMRLSGLASMIAGLLLLYVVH